MKKFCLIGHPLGHSMSPLIHKELFALKGIDASYELCDIALENIGGTLELLKDFDGFNVTIPHKTAIIQSLDKLSPRAELFGAVNTVAIKDGDAIGHNTDCEGFLRTLKSVGIELGGKVIVCGSGGVSRMFAFESVLAGAELTLAVRKEDEEAANIIKNEISAKLQKDIDVKTLDEISEGCDLLINGTPVGMYPNTNACVLPSEIVKKCRAVFDAVYNPLETQLIKYAKEAGVKCSNGLPMLVWQAAVAQEIWFDVKFSAEELDGVLKITEGEIKKR